MSDRLIWTGGRWNPRKGGRAKVWRTKCGTYEVTYRDEFYGVASPPPNFQAVVRQKRPGSGVVTYFVEPHKRYRTVGAAMDACEKHRKQTCLSMNTPASAGIKPKNSKLLRDQIASALTAAKPKDSSEQSAKSASPNLEARLSRNSRGVSAKAGGTKPLDYSHYQQVFSRVKGTGTTVACAMAALSLPTTPEAIDLTETVLGDMGLVRCGYCGWWMQKQGRSDLCTDCAYMYHL